ncbi:glycerophosphodiester phosphodiesterase [Granulosicoccus sp.]|nr:glycerophosphodiester phosphodiesterase [Granulosicoccus sp.]
MLYAHRGSSVLAPENTMPAFELALKYGADIMEIDVRLSRDGHVVVFHDERLDRTTNGRGRVIDSSLAQLQALDAGYRFVDPDGQSFRDKGTRVMSLTQMFEQLPDTPINIDIKDNSNKAAAAVADTIDKANRHTTVNVGSFHAPALEHFRQLLPQVTTAATQAEVAQLYFKRSQYKIIAFEYLQIPLRYFGIPLASPAFIRHATERGIKSVYWTINNRKTMELLVERKVTGIVTDRVDIAGPLLGKKAVSQP